jgi:lipoyl(octanoyl) transferase
MNVRWLGRIKYEDALALQNELVALKANDSGAPDELLLMEHEPVFTIGRTQNQSSLRNPEKLSAPLVVINRGGQATWHGPGQLVGYPILDLRRRGSDLHRYLRELEEMIIIVCAEFGVSAQRREGLTGVWIADRKVASIGVGVKRWISMHGFALNVCGALKGFDDITPCGLSGVTITSLEREGARAVTVKGVADVSAKFFARMFPAEAPVSDS